jgi:hypothetical protein
MKMNPSKLLIDYYINRENKRPDFIKQDYDIDLATAMLGNNRIRIDTIYGEQIMVNLQILYFRKYQV